MVYTLLLKPFLELPTKNRVSENTGFYKNPEKIKKAIAKSSKKRMVGRVHAKLTKVFCRASKTL